MLYQNVWLENATSNQVICHFLRNCSTKFNLNNICNVQVAFVHHAEVILNISKEEQQNISKNEVKSIGHIILLIAEFYIWQ